MANSIALAKNYIDAIDAVYKAEAKTSILDADPATVRLGNAANEIVVPVLTMSGLGDYSRNSGYTSGDVTVTYETMQFNYDRGRKFNVDAMDDEETAQVAFGQLGAEFTRTKVASEGDAFTFATLAGADGVTTVSATLADGTEVLSAIQAAVVAMDEAEVPAEQRILFITPTNYKAVLALDTYKSRQLLEGLTVVEVPQSRFYSAITLGTDGYSKAAAGKELNFMLVHKPAVLKFDKHTASDIITPSANQEADAYMMKFRKYGIVKVYGQKAAGIYVHTVA